MSPIDVVGGARQLGRYALGFNDDLAYGIPCKASDESMKPASNVTDGRQDTFWWTVQARAWVELDLSSRDPERRPVQVTQIIIFWHGNCHADSFRIQTSTGESWHTVLEEKEARHCCAAEGYRYRDNGVEDAQEPTGCSFNRISKLPRLEGSCSRIRLEMSDGHPDMWFRRYQFGIRRLVVRGYYSDELRNVSFSLDNFRSIQRTRLGRIDVVAANMLPLEATGIVEEVVSAKEAENAEPSWLLASRRKRRSGGAGRSYPPPKIRSNGFPTVSLFMQKSADVGGSKAWLSTGSTLLRAANRKRLDEARQGLRPCSTQANRRLLEEAAAKGTGEEMVDGEIRDELGVDSREVNSRCFTASTQESDSDRKIRSSESRLRSRGKAFLPSLPSTLYDNFVCRVGSRSYTPPHHKRYLSAHEQWLLKNASSGGHKSAGQAERSSWESSTGRAVGRRKTRLGAESRFWPSEEEKEILRSTASSLPRPVRRRSLAALGGQAPRVPSRDDEGESAAMSSGDAASLMSGWEEVRTADGEVYYANCTTGESAWERPTRMEADWMEYFSPEGDKYYVNEATGLSTWTRPVLSRPTRDGRRSSGSDGVAVSELRQTLGAALGGEDWTDWRRKKADDGKVYYYNVKTKATAWNLPTPVLSKAPDAPPGWKKVAEGDGGEEFYYWNEATDEVTWDFPLPFYEEQDEVAASADA
ncbi:hypothetical protein FOZ60_003456 [Perkinsus olseni]|uniref:WW domain-containing protein n=1 Tax=Perkinsus olseni TaxID=32597 RepID=A0A7J6NVL1_PEROL|nr:hypothetical protein FOZ60_003456 [Perkinsus olseni]